MEKSKKEELLKKVRSFFPLKSPVDIRNVFELYNKIFFLNQLDKKLEEETIIFDLGGSFPGDVYKKNGEYHFVINHKNSMEKILMAVEHNIIHLIIYLWGFFMKNPLRADIYGKHGKLFHCLAKRFFDHAELDHDLLPYSKYGGYKYYSNSCYTDSLLMILLFSKSSFWKNSILDSEGGYTNVASICDKNSKIKSLKEIASLSEDLKKQLKFDYKNIKQGNKVYCSSVRDILQKCLTSMKEKDKWVIMNVGETYDVLSKLFTEMILNIPYKVYKKGEWVYDTLKSVPMIEVSDYITEPDEENYSVVDWDNIDSPVLVFSNTNLRIKDMTKKGREKNTTKTEDGTEFEYEVNKIRTLGSYILDDRYELVGVVVLSGVPKIGSGGSHYTCYYKSETGAWYYYDDLSSESILIKKLPVSVFKDEEKLPQMYFYERIEKKKEIIFKGEYINYKKVIGSDLVWYLVKGMEKDKVQFEPQSYLKDDPIWTFKNIKDNKKFEKTLFQEIIESQKR